MSRWVMRVGLVVSVLAGGGLWQQGWGALSGELDGTFAGAGHVTTALGSGVDRAQEMAVQSDGKTLVVGTVDIAGDTTGALVRYNADGTLDTSFSGDGKQFLFYGTYTELHGVVVQADGKIVVAGTSLYLGDSDVLLARYLPNGTLDTSFDGDGIKTYNSSSLATDIAVGVVMQADNKIVATGTVQNGMVSSTATWRFNANGSIDTTFNGTGMKAITVGTTNERNAKVIMQGDNKIVTVGTAQVGGTNDFVVTRLLANGTVDPAFGGGDGIAITAVGTGSDEATCVTLQPDGKILVGGEYIAGAVRFGAVVRYLANGTLDTNFGSGGKVFVAYGPGNNSVRDVALMGDGRIVAVGYSGSDIGLARFLPGGGLDASFNGDGLVVSNVSTGVDAVEAVTLVGNGDLLVAGTTFVGVKNAFALLRYRGTSDLWTQYEMEAAELFAYYSGIGQPNLALAAYYEKMGLARYHYGLSIGDLANAEFFFYSYKGKQLKYLQLQRKKPKLAKYFDNINLAMAYKRYWTILGYPKKAKTFYTKYRNIALAARR